MMEACATSRWILGWREMPIGLLILSIFLSVSPVANSQEYDPQHPEVREMVRRGVNYLVKSEKYEYERHAHGVELLMALAIYKGDEEADLEHPRIKRGLQIALEIADRLSLNQYKWLQDSMYSVPVAGMLLASVDPIAYDSQIRTIRDTLLSIQRPNGGFGYMTEIPNKHKGQGDISQTQYVNLCLWTFSQVGFEIPSDALVRCMQFLETAQKPDGAWAYQYPPDGNQDDVVSSSRVAAGLCAYLIACDTVGLFRSKSAKSDVDEEGLIPSVFRRVDTTVKQKIPPNLSLSRVEQTIKKGEDWLQSTPYNKTSYFYYYMYSRERYESFLELSRGKILKSPDWYNSGVAELKKFQNNDGSWGSMPGDVDGELSPQTCTSFAILYLIRSTQRSIGQLHDDMLLGGHGLPEDPTSIVVRNGRIQSKTISTNIDDALKLLDDENQAEGQERLIPEQLELPSDRKQRREQLTRFSRLMNSKDVNTRRFTAKLLGRGDDLEFVPALIYGLSDPDQTVARLSESSLRLISRQLNTHHLPKDEELTLNHRNNAIVKWRAWYKTVRPEYVFSD